MNFQYLLKILAYLMFVIITYFISNNSYQRYSRRLTLSTDKSYKRYSWKISLLEIIFLSTIIGIYSIIATKYPYSSDRGNYVVRFVNYADSPWTPGFNMLVDFIHLFTNEPKVLFFTVSFLCLFITLVAYNIFEDARPKALLLMSISTYCIDSFFLLKQAPSVAFAAISFALFFKRRFKLSIIFLIIAILFHEAALILIPIYIVLLGANKRWVRTFQYIILISSVLFFREISDIVLGFISNWIPGLNVELATYLDESGSIKQSNNILTVLKGFPYYFLTFYAMLKRSYLKPKIQNYDSYLLLCVFSSAITIMSVYMYWMSRFATYCYFPMFIFVALILREDKGRDKQIFYLLVAGSLFFFTVRYLYQIYFWHGGF